MIVDGKHNPKNNCNYIFPSNWLKTVCRGDAHKGLFNVVLESVQEQIVDLDFICEMFTDRLICFSDDICCNLKSAHGNKSMVELYLDTQIVLLIFNHQPLTYQPLLSEPNNTLLQGFYKNDSTELH